jgi:NAD-dependent DNA ligase
LDFENKKDIIVPPTKCPSCCTKILKEKDKVRYYCPNYDNCFEQQKHRLIYAVGKQ